MTTGKTVALTRWTFVGKVMSLLFNMQSRSVITFLPRSKCLLISWLKLPSAVILESKKIKSFTVSIVSPSICYEVMRTDAMIFVFWMLSLKRAFWLSSFIKQALGVGDGQGSLTCYSPWGRGESDTTERLNWTELSSRGSLVPLHFLP